LELQGYTEHHAREAQRNYTFMARGDGADASDGHSHIVFTASWRSFFLISEKKEISKSPSAASGVSVRILLIYGLPIFGKG
jgi:hypothetical protein